ncbi:MAG TPA: hypothetical protein VMV36_05945 [Ignavibacteriaceae bacterium]|nr:hypothetical protein [Ignavibacteriaceae bacterium]
MRTKKKAGDIVDKILNELKRRIDSSKATVKELQVLRNSNMKKSNGYEYYTEQILHNEIRRYELESFLFFAEKSIKKLKK